MFFIKHGVYKSNEMKPYNSNSHDNKSLSGNIEVEFKNTTVQQTY